MALRLARFAIAGLSIALVALVIWSASALLVWRWRVDPAGNGAGLQSLALVSMTAALGATLAATVTAILTAQLVKLTDTMARIQKDQDDARRAVAVIEEDTFRPILEEEGESRPELYLRVKNVGSREMEITSILVKVTTMHPDFDDQGKPIGVDFYPTTERFAISRADHLGGAANPIPVDALAEYSMPGHGLVWDSDISDYQLGVELSDGRQFWALSRKAPKSMEGATA